MKTFWNNLPKPFFVLAPMEAVTDVVFRHVVASAAPADIYFTEFTNATSFINPKGRHSTRGRLEFTEDEQPMVAQIWGAVPEHFSLMSKELKKMGFSGIDINMGCPDKSVIKTGSCSALIENHSLAAEIIAATKEGGLPVSVKTRIGLKVQKTEEWGSFLLEQDLAALTIHARTQKEMSKVPARWEEVGAVVKLRDRIAPQTVIIGNGDVENRQSGEELAKKYSVDGIMIGRGIFHNPFAFEETPQNHTKEELLALLAFHLYLYDAATKLHPRKFDPLKRFFKIYVRDFSGASELRARLMECKTTTEVRQILSSYQIL